ncbi:MAG: nucleotide sugar dehydrogenase [Hyphomicrobiaceae bacterium]|nr:nucleotide sugar dehydrogenase [Hyphomicrobiaceae bacterium]
MQVTRAELKSQSVAPVANVAPKIGIGYKPSISVIGLGYVGAVSMACLAHLGFRMVGVDVSQEKVNAIKEGRSPIVEDRLGELLSEGARVGKIDATQNLVAAVLDTDVTFMSVGTPTAPDGSCDLTYVRQASRAIGQAIGMKTGFHVVVLRCSVPPGTTLDVVAPEIERASGKKAGLDFGIAFNPEFLREGVAVADFYAPPKTVIGASDVRTEEIVSRIYGAVDDKIQFTTIAAAEMVKYVDNVWHATKVAFGNEVGRLCKSLDIDSHAVMNIFVTDTKLNLSPYYLKPGFAFGGSCLPKEVRAVAHLAETQNVDLPLIQSLGRTNQRHIEEAARLLAEIGGERIGFLGVTFKPATDDLRESPTLELMSMVEAKGLPIKVYDPNLRFNDNLKGQIAYVRHSCPSQARVMDRIEEICVPSIDALMSECDVIVVSHATEEFRQAVRNRRADIRVLDLARLFKELPVDDATYQGIAW